MQRISLEVTNRDNSKPEFSNPKKVRSAGFVPGVIYGHGNPMPIMVDAKIFQKAIHSDAGVNALFNVSFGGETALSLIKEVQRDQFTQVPIHVDFQRINMKEKVDLNVPIHLKGIPKGVKEEGGILEHNLREVHIRCLPDDIPGHIDVDVSNLDVHEGIKLAEIPAPKGVEFLTTKDHVVAHVIVPRVEEIPAPTAAAEGEASAEPEVIAKGKKEEEGAEAGKAAPGAKAPAGKEEKK